MPTVVDESDLEVVSEEDLQSMSAQAAERRAGIAAAPLPETQRPPIWNPKSRAATRFVSGVALPSIAAAPFTGGASILAGMGGAAAAEGLDYAMSPEEERPSLAGAASRVAATGAIPYAFGKVAGKLAPVLKSVPIPKAVPPGPEQFAMAKLGGKIGHAVGEALPSGAKTLESEIRTGLLKELEHYSPGIAANDVAKVFKTWFDPKKALPAGLDAVRKQFTTLADDIVEEAKALGGNLPLTRVEELLDDFNREAYVGAGKAAAKQAGNALRTAIKNFLKDTHGEEVATQYANLTAAIHTRFDVAKALAQQVSKNPIVSVKRLLSTPQARQFVQAFDNINGTQFGAALDEVAAQLNAVTAGKAAKGATREAAIALRAAQDKARNFLKGMIVTTAGIAGGVSGGTLGGASGAIMGSTGMSGLLLSLLAGRAKGAIPLETLAAGTAKGLAVAARPIAATAGKTAEALFGQPEAPPPAEISESDLEEPR